MDIFSLILISAVVGANNFAVAITLGIHRKQIEIKRVVAVFVLFETLIPLVGAFIGLTLLNVIGISGNIIGGSLLVGLGFLMFKSALKPDSEESIISKMVNSWKGLLLLALGLSLDNLIVGFSLGLSNAQPFILSATIGVFSFIFINLGIYIGRKSKTKWGNYSKIATASLLILIGITDILGYL